MIRGLAEMTDTVGCTDVPVFRRPVRRHPELIDDRPYDSVSHEKHYEKAGGAPDKPSVEQREQRAAEIFSITTEGFDDSGMVLETDLRYRTDIASSTASAAHDRRAGAIAFTPRGGSRWRKLVTGDVTHNLVRSSGIPVPPDREESEA